MRQDQRQYLEDVCKGPDSKQFRVWGTHTVTAEYSPVCMYMCEGMCPDVYVTTI